MVIPSASEEHSGRMRKDSHQCHSLAQSYNSKAIIRFYLTMLCGMIQLLQAQTSCK